LALRQYDDFYFELGVLAGVRRRLDRAAYWLLAAPVDIRPNRYGFNPHSCRQDRCSL